MAYQGSFQDPRNRPPSTAHRVVMALLVFLLPMLAAIIQSSWVFMNRPNREYQALLHPHNYNPVWLILIVEAAITAVALWPLSRSPIVQVLMAAFLLSAFVCYAFNINHLAIR